MAAVCRDVVKSVRVTNKTCSFTAELIAPNLALDIIRQTRHH